MEKDTGYMGHPVGGPYMSRKARRELDKGLAQPGDDHNKIDNLFLANKDLEAQLALYKKALELAARDIFCPDILCDENSSKYGVCEVDCKSNYYLAQAKEAVPDGPDRS